MYIYRYIYIYIDIYKHIYLHIYICICTSVHFYTPSLALQDTQKGDSSFGSGRQKRGSSFDAEGIVVWLLFGGSFGRELD